MLGINLKIFIAQLVNFSIVLLVLWKWVYTPLVRLLDERSTRIEKSMKQADEIETRLKDVERSQSTIITEAKTQAALLLDQARTDSDRRRKELIDAAKSEVQKVVAQGKEQLKTEKSNMLAEAKLELIEIAVAAATKILQESVTEKTAQKLAEDVVKKMV